jgi:hypothetical protein
MEVIPMLATVRLVIVSVETINLETLSIHRARHLGGQRIVVSFLVGKPPYTWKGSTIVGTIDMPDVVERTAVLKGWRLASVREGKRVAVSGVLRFIDHPARVIGGTIVTPWQEIRVATQ